MLIRTMPEALERIAQLEAALLDAAQLLEHKTGLYQPDLYRVLLGRRIGLEEMHTYSKALLPIKD